MLSLRTRRCEFGQVSHAKLAIADDGRGGKVGGFAYCEEAVFHRFAAPVKGCGLGRLGSHDCYASNALSLAPF